jgi:hypothetical protein
MSSYLGLERLLFDRADVDGSPQLGAHVIGDGNAVITSHDVSGDEGLDVYLLNPTVSVDDITIGGNTLAIDGSGFITANINGTVTVDATDLDIRQLLHTGASPDSVQIGDGTEILQINADGSIDVQFNSDADDAASTYNPISVGGVSADQSSALTALSAAGDRFHLLSDLYRRVFVNDSPNVGLSNEAVSVGLTAVALPTTAQAGRMELHIQNNGNKSIFIGDASVTTANGIEVSKNSTYVMKVGEAVGVYAISGTAAQDVRVLELA